MKWFAHLIRWLTDILMQRYAQTGPEDSPSMDEGDSGWMGVDSYTSAENLPPGMAQAATNIDFESNDAVTRGGFVCIPELGDTPFGMAWTSRTPAAANNWKAIVYGNGIFVAVSTTGAGNRVQTSPDGITWTSRSSAADYSWNDVTYGNGLFVAVTSSGTTDRVQTSPDGITWTLRTTPNHAWQGVTYGGGLFVAVGTSVGMTSPDGIVWTDRTVVSGEQWRAVAYGNGTYVAVSILGGIMSSPNAITWTDRTPITSYAWTDIAYGNNIFVLLGGAGIVFTSSDGITFTQRTATNADAWVSLAYGGPNAGFAAVANTGSGDQVMTSISGIGWAQQENIPVAAWSGIAFGTGVFVAVASNAVMTSNTSVLTVFATSTYSDPNQASSQWIMLVGTNTVGFYAFGMTPHIVNITAGETVSTQSTIIQCNNLVFIWRGPDEKPLVWDGDWGSEFELATGTIPNARQATYYQNRQWATVPKDSIFASDVLSFTVFTEITNQFNLNTGDSNFVVATYPFGTNTLIVFKNRSILALQNVDGSLTDVIATEITRQVGIIGINSVISVGPDLAYVSDRNINLLTLTATDNALQHKTLPLSTPIKAIFDRVNWQAANKISMAYWDNKLYVALPLDNSSVCNSVVVYNFVSGAWFGEWNFSATIGLPIIGWAVANYLGLQRLHAVTEDGRIFVTNEGPLDISGTVTAEISTSLTTRPYKMDDNQKFSRRIVLDISTNRPNFSVNGFTGAEGSEIAIITDRTYSRSQTWKFSDSPYSLTNSGDDYNRPWRKDYSALPSESVQPQGGFFPEALQSIRLPLVTRRKARLLYFSVLNTTGTMRVNGLSLEAIGGDRQSTPQLG